MKKIIAVLLCAAMLLALAAGCANGPDEPAPYEPGTPEDTLQTDAEQTDAESEWGENGDIPDNVPDHECTIFDFEAAFNAFPPDTVMTTVGDFTITWEELFFGLYVTLWGVNNMLGTIPGWYEPIGDDMRFGFDGTFGEFLLSAAEEQVLNFVSVQYGAALHNVSLSQEHLNIVRFQLDAEIAEHGGAEALTEFLWADRGIRSLEVFENFSATAFLLDVLRDNIFGPDNTLLTDEQAEAFYAGRDDGFMMAKHILLMADIDQDFDHEDARDAANAIWERLYQYTGDDFEAFFDELMFQYSMDPGLVDFPDGYLFQFFDMVPEFSQAASELEFGQFSEPVETSHGFHIVLRVPLNFDEIPFSFMGMGQFDTLRSYAALHLFSFMWGDWFEALQPVRTNAFNSIVLSEIFVPC